MIKRLKEKYLNQPLVTKIRFSFLVVIVPVVLFVLIVILSVFGSNKRYEEMMNSAVMASDFSLDFKKDFDYETYLVIVGNKSIEDSGLDKLLADANRVVEGLENLTESQDNIDRLSNVKKYLENLAIYKERIEENLQTGNKYEDNIEIWENDVQIVTSLVRETIFQYIFYEIRVIQQMRQEYELFYLVLSIVLIVVFVIILGVILFFSYVVPQSITKPIREITDITNQVANGDLSVRAKEYPGEEAAVLSTSLNAMIEKINTLLSQVTEEQIHLREAELELLQSQINPHFLYNTLDTIVWLAEGNRQQEVVEMVKTLSDFFRTSLSRGRDIVSLDDEILHVNSYLKIQQVRYQDILEYEINVDPALKEFTIPKITIQPLVENALYHGIKNKRGLGKISISSSRDENCFYIYVEDNGRGMTKERLEEVASKLNSPYEAASSDEKKNMYGLLNVNERIKLKYGSDYGISVESEDGVGSKVTIKLPYEKNQPKS